MIISKNRVEYCLYEAPASFKTVQCGTIKHTGSHSLKIKLASSGDQHQSISHNFGTDISGRQFKISAFVKTQGVIGTGVKILTYWQDSNGWIWSNNSASNAISGTTDWSRLEATGIAPIGAKKLTVLVQPTVNGQGLYWVDSIEVVKVAYDN